MVMKRVVILFALLVAYVRIAGADGNVLIVGSTHPFSQQKGAAALDEKKIIALVKKTLLTDMRVRGRMNIEFEEIYRSKSIPTAYGGGGGMRQVDYRCHSLAQWYFWPDGLKERLDSLQGAGKTKWDAVVLIGDPYVIANMPGMYTEGVKLIVDAVRKGKAQPVLIINGGDDQSAEVVCRVGQGLGIPVGPTRTVTKLKRQCVGAYDVPNPFAMKHVFKRNITFNHTGSSSEAGIQRALTAATQRCGVKAVKTGPQEGKPKIDFNYGRGNSGFEKPKQYKVAPDKFERAYGFPMQDHSNSAAETMLYGIDKRMFNGNSYEDGTDLGIAWDMVKQDEVKHDIRAIPIRLMWAKFHEADPAVNPCGDRWHMSGHLHQASGTYIYTLLSGRCPIGDKPPENDQKAWRNWLGQKIGYETAWRMSHLTARVPGFAVKPVGDTETLAANGSVDIMVRFHYQPTSDVVVSVVTDNPKALAVKQATLTFTPENYSEAQKVTVAAGVVAADTIVRVRFQTASKDEVFNQLRDFWSYTVTGSKP